MCRCGPWERLVRVRSSERSRFIFLVLLAVVVFGMHSRARADVRWDDSSGVGIGVLAEDCATSELLQAYTGYQRDEPSSYPATGDVGYIRAVVLNPNYPLCAQQTVSFDFVLPEGMLLNVTADTPVKCLAGHFDGRRWEVARASDQYSCLQSPTAGMSGFGLNFGFMEVAATWAYEIRVPVAYIRPLDGHGSASELEVLVHSNSTPPGGIPITQPIEVAYQPRFPTPPVLSNVTGTSVRIEWVIEHYFVPGVLFLEHEFAHEEGSGELRIREIDFPLVGNLFAEPWSLRLADLQEASTYRYRTRYETPRGLFYSPWHMFVTGREPRAELALSIKEPGMGNVDTGNLNFVGDGDVITHDLGTSLSLTPFANFGFVFSGWSGTCDGFFGACIPDACSGFGRCEIAFASTARYAVTANFVRAGILELSVSGPAGASSDVEVRVSSASGFEETVRVPVGTPLEVTLVPGEYVVEAPPYVVDDGDLFQPSPQSQTVVVPGYEETGGDVARVSIDLTEVEAIPEAKPLLKMPRTSMTGDQPA